MQVCVREKAQAATCQWCNCTVQLAQGDGGRTTLSNSYHSCTYSRCTRGVTVMTLARSWGWNLSSMGWQPRPSISGQNLFWVEQVGVERGQRGDRKEEFNSLGWISPVGQTQHFPTQQQNGSLSLGQGFCRVLREIAKKSFCGIWPRSLQCNSKWDFLRD